VLAGPWRKLWCRRLGQEKKKKAGRRNWARDRRDHQRESEHGVDQKRLVLVEYNPGLLRVLRERYPKAKVVAGDAYKLRDSLGKSENPRIRRGVRPALVTKDDD